MKLMAVAFLALAMAFNSALAIAEGPVPFGAMMQSAAAQPNIPARSDSEANSAAAPIKPAHDHMTPGGKVMLGAGIGLGLVGGFLIFAGVEGGGSGSSSGGRAAILGIGAGFAGGGAVLIVAGVKRRTTK